MEDSSLLLRILAGASSMSNQSNQSNHLSPEAISSLPRTVLPDVSDRPDTEASMCSICHDNMTAGQTVITLDCNHTYHDSCIIDWFQRHRHNTCPICRAVVQTTVDGDDVALSSNPQPELIAEIPLHRILTQMMRISITFVLPTTPYAPEAAVRVRTSWDPRHTKVTDLIEFVKHLTPIHNAIEVVLIGSLHLSHTFRSSQSYSALSKTLYNLGVDGNCTFTVALV